jgi:hypothetical protein
MTPDDFMKIAIALSANCKSEEEKRTPRFVVVIAEGNEIVGLVD